MKRIDLAEFGVNITDAEKDLARLLKQVVDLKGKTKDYANQLKLTESDIKSYTKQADKMAKAGEKESDAYNEIQTSLKAAQKQREKQINVLEQSQATLKSTNKSYRESIKWTEKLRHARSLNVETYQVEGKTERQLLKDKTALIAQRKQEVKITGEQSEASKKLNATIDTINTTLKENSSESEKRLFQIGEYSQGIKQAFSDMASGNITGGLALMKTSLLGLAGALRTLTVATLSNPITAIAAAVTAVGVLLFGNKDIIIDFDNSLRDVGKTSNISGDELEAFGDKVIELSTRLETVSVQEILEVAKVAGQLGVQKENILAFSEAMVKLTESTNIEGEEGATQIARLLKLTDGGTENVGAFGDEIVNLGNNLAATEKEILKNATGIAQAASQYDISRQATLQFGAATAATGLQAESSSTVIGKLFATLDNAQRTGEGMEEFSRVTGLSVTELNDKFKEGTEVVAHEYIKGLNDLSNEGGSVSESLSTVGLSGERVTKVLGTLATKGFATLSESIELTTKASGALGNEFESSQQKLQKQFGRVKIAWENLVLSFDNGQGIFSKVATVLAGALATSLNGVAEASRYLGAIFSTVVAVIKTDIDIVVGAVKEFYGLMINLKNIEFGSGMFDKAKSEFSKFTKNVSTNTKKLNANLKIQGKGIMKEFNDAKSISTSRSNSNTISAVKPKSTAKSVASGSKTAKATATPATKAAVKQRDILREVAEENIKIAKLELDEFIANNQTKITDSQRLTSELVSEETLRLESIHNKKIAFANKEAALAKSNAKKDEDNAKIRALKVTQVEKERAAKVVELEKAKNEALAELTKDFTEDEREALKIVQAEKLQDDLEALDLHWNAENEKKRVQAEYDYEQEKIDAGIKFEDGLITKQQQDLVLMEAEQAKNVTLGEVDRLTNEQKIAGAKSTLENVTSLLGEHTAAGKAAGIATATINTYQGISEVWRSPSTLPEPFATIQKLLSAGIVLKSGLNTVKEIRKTKTPKAAKGFVFGGNSHKNGGNVLYDQFGSPIIETEKDEVNLTLNKRATPLIKALSSINTKTGGIPLAKTSYAAKGGITPSIASTNSGKFVVQFDYDKMGEAVSDGIGTKIYEGTYDANVDSGIDNEIINSSDV